MKGDLIDLVHVLKGRRVADERGWFSGKPPHSDTNSSRGRQRMSALGRLNMMAIAYLVRKKAGSANLELNLPSELD